MNELGKLFQRPEYIHVLLNPIPFYVLGVGVVILLVAIVRRKRESQLVGLWTLLFACAVAWPTWYFGHQAYHHLYELLTTEGQRWADLHLRLADWIVYVFYATGALALAAIFLPREIPKATTLLAVLALLAATVCLGLGAWIGRAGGQVRHSEFRDGPLPQPADHKTHEHH
jgi:uncharacterized membrane protein